MNRNLARLVRSSLVSSLALAALLTVGCSSNRLDPLPVPKAELNGNLPKWYPEKPWTAKEGQSQIYIQGKIVFDTGSATIHKYGESEKVLKTLLQFVNDHPEVTRFRIEGHTDDRGDEQKNQELSAQRALSVCNWLVDNGVNHLRLLAVGFGQSKPLGPNELAEGRAENRRTEFHVAEIDGKPYLGKDPTAGGLVLDVPSLEERKREEEERKKRGPAAAPPTLKWKPTGNEVKKVPGGQIEIDPTQGKPK
ncbi:MAG: OmpA family protein [Polyangiaceae bacterium]|nr:OmpA family protein [Polyangiaceae bacterium]